MSRRFFLIGNLTGLSLGILLMVLIQSRPAPPQSEPKPLVVPISAAANEPAENPRNRMIIPFEDLQEPMNRWTRPHLQEPSPIPPDWTWKEFNGQRVYLIPLSQNEAPTLR